MERIRSFCFLLLALLLPVLAIPAHAQLSFGISFNVGIAPPVLPVYEVPVCPEPNLMWTPGYWAWDPGYGDYYWVPGAWVPAPYVGALWTPPYWGWYGGHYGFHTGYWGSEVGYYGGVNYGGGYLGIGFAGGEWRGGEFAYNTAVVNVNTTIIHNTYINRTIVEQNTSRDPNHFAYAGGPHGIQHEPTPQELTATHQQHTPPTRFQTAHVATARADKASFSKANGGHPRELAVAKPLAAARVAAPAGMKTAAGAPKAEPRTATRTNPGRRGAKRRRGQHGQKRGTLPPGLLRKKRLPAQPELPEQRPKRLREWNQRLLRAR